MEMKIDWSQIVTNALTTLVGAMFVGAFAIIWNGVMTFDDRIKETETELKATIEVMSEQLESLNIELNKFNKLYKKLDDGDEKKLKDSISTAPKQYFKKDNIKEQIDIRQQTIRKH